eukprot:2910870-Pleurochrysis_carterae.AAC.1
MQLKFATIWEGSLRLVEISPFTINNVSAVEFVCAVLDSKVGVTINHSYWCLSDAVALQVVQLLLGAKGSNIAFLAPQNTGVL